MALEVGARWLRSPRTWVGSVAVLDVVVRLPEDLLALVSIVGAVAGGPTIVTATTYLLFAVAFYAFAPLAYGPLPDLPRAAPGFRAIFAGGAVGLGAWLRFVAGTPAQLVLVVLPAFVTIGGTFLLYLSSVRGWELLDPDGPAVGVIKRFVTGWEPSPAFAAGRDRWGRHGLLDAGLYLTAIGLVLALPPFLVGLLTPAFVLAYPIPDLLCLGWAVGIPLAGRTAAGPDRDDLRERRFDPEAYLVDAVDDATRGLQGFVLVTFVFTGVVVSAGHLGLLVRALPLFGERLSFQFQLAFYGGVVSWPAVAFLWSFVGVAVLFVATAGLACYGWFRELERLPHFLDRWEGRTTTTGEPPPRLPGLTLLPVASMALVLAFGLAVARELLPFAVASYGFAVVWPAVAGLGWLAVRRARRGPAQPVAREHYWIAGGVLLQLYLIRGSLLVLDGESGSLVSALIVPTVAVAVGAALPALVDRRELD